MVTTLTNLEKALSALGYEVRVDFEHNEVQLYNRPDEDTPYHDVAYCGRSLFDVIDKLGKAEILTTVKANLADNGESYLGMEAELTEEQIEDLAKELE